MTDTSTRFNKFRADRHNRTAAMLRAAINEDDPTQSLAKTLKCFNPHFEDLAAVLVPILEREFSEQ